MKKKSKEITQTSTRIPGLIALMTAEGSVEFINQPLQDYFGRTLQDLKDWAISDAVHSDDLPAVVDAWSRSFESGQPYHIDHRCRRADGEYRWFHVSALPLRDDAGCIFRWYVLLTDIHELKKAQEKFREDKKELKRISDSLPYVIAVFRSDGKRKIGPCLVGQNDTEVAMSSPNNSSRHRSICSSESAQTTGRQDRSLIPEKAAPLRNGATLLDGLRSGDQHAYEELVLHFSGRLFSTARRYLRSDADACDAVQNAFVCAFKSIASFNGDSQLSTWLHRIVVNCALMHLRARRRRGEIENVEIDDLLPRFDASGNWIEHKLFSPAAYLSVEASETKALVRQCIDLLPENYRTVLILRDIDELDTEEAGRSLNLTPSTVKVRLHRARQALKVLLERHPDFRTR